MLVLFLVPLVSAQSLQIGLINQDPDPVTAGDVVKVRFKVENLWETTKDPVIIEIMPEYPFTLYSGERVKNLGILSGRQTGVEAPIIDYRLKVDESAVDGDNEIGIKVKVGETNWVYEDDFFIEVENEEIRLRNYIRSSNLIVPESKGKVSIEFANAGGYDLEFFEVWLLPSDDYKLLSTSNYVYIGDIDSDDTESEEFEIYVPKDVREVNIPIKVSYEVNDFEYASEETLTLQLLNSGEAESIGLIKSDTGKNIIWGILIGLAILYFYRRYRKR